MSRRDLTGRRGFGRPQAAPTALLFLVLFALPAAAQNFIFQLRGDQEVPPVPSVASGGCMATLSGTTLSITCVHDVVGATIMHIHRGAPGVNGPIVFDLGDPASPVTATWTGMTASDINDLVTGNLYINIHTAGRPAGEIRGQIVTRSIDNVAFTADGSQYVPPNSTSATASCTADLDNAATFLAVSCTHNVPSPTAAHVHEAPVHVNGPIVFTFASPASPLSANIPMTPRLVADFEATFLYLDVHSGSGSEDTSSPQIRGQIGTPPAGASTGTILIKKLTSPGGGSGFGFTDNIASPNAFTLNDGQTQTFNAVPAGTYTVTENDPSPGHSLTDVKCDDAASSADPFTRTATINLAPGEVVTCTFKNVLTTPPDSIFAFRLDGTQEVPPTGSTAQGGCFAQFYNATSRLNIVCTHNVVGPTLMHIHRGAAGVNGPILFDLGSPVSPVIATWDAMPPADVTDLFAGNLYINIHTAGRPAGEIRGQIVVRSVDTVSFALNSAQVVPPGTSTATGNCSADLNAAATSLAVNCTHNLPSPDLAHVHEGAAGTNGPAVFTFPNAAAPSANVPMSPRLVADYEGGLLYVDVHSSGGSEETTDEIRGQIGAPPSGLTTGTIRIVKATQPAGGSGFGFTDDIGAPSAFTLNDTGAQTFTSVAPGTYTVTENDPAASGYTLTSIVCDDADSTTNPFNRTATVRLQPGELVTCTFRNLQTIPSAQIFVFHLNGAQEVPPVPTTARGGCMAQLDAAAARMSIICTHNVADATIMHIHRGAPGVNGPIVFDLGSPISPVQATWTGMTPGDIADVLAGNLYVNIHASGRPAGEIRGQILPRTVDHFAFFPNGAQEVPPTTSTATARCTADLSDNAQNLAVQCTHNVSGATNAHIHDAPPGVDGPVVITLPAATSFSVNAVVNPRLVADFAAGFLYVNIHSLDFPEGEIRGQMVAEADIALSDIPTLYAWAAIAFAALLCLAALRRL